MLYEYIDEILRLKKEKGISYKAMSIKTGIHENTIYKFLHGEIITNVEYFLMICESVGFDLWQKDTVKKLEEKAENHKRLAKLYQTSCDGRKALDEHIRAKAFKDAIKIVKGEKDE